MPKKEEKAEGKEDVIVYSTPTCPYCSMAKAFLEENKIDYKNIDVSTDVEAAREMVEKSGQMGVPVIDVKGTIIIGFDQEALKNAIKSLKK